MHELHNIQQDLQCPDVTVKPIPEVNVLHLREYKVRGLDKIGILMDALTFWTVQIFRMFKSECITPKKEVFSVFVETSLSDSTHTNDCVIHTAFFLK